MVDALPARDRKGGDLGLINLAAALPQAWAPLLSLGTLALFSGGYRPVLWLSTAVFLLGAALFLGVRRR